MGEYQGDADWSEESASPGMVLAQMWEACAMVKRALKRTLQNDAIMTGTEVADFLRVHLSSVRRWSRSGELKAYKVGNRGDWRYRHQDVLAFLGISPTAD